LFGSGADSLTTIYVLNNTMRRGGLYTASTEWNANMLELSVKRIFEGLNGNGRIEIIALTLTLSSMINPENDPHV
jgi:hypothetical protein